MIKKPIIFQSGNPNTSRGSGNPIIKNLFNKTGKKDEEQNSFNSSNISTSGINDNLKEKKIVTVTSKGTGGNNPINISMKPIVKFNKQDSSSNSSFSEVKGGKAIVIKNKLNTTNPEDNSIDGKNSKNFGTNYSNSNLTNSKNTDASSKIDISDYNTDYKSIISKNKGKDSIMID